MRKPASRPRRTLLAGLARACAIAAAMSACGGSDPLPAPTPPDAPAPTPGATSLPAGTLLTITSGESGAPVPGASVTLTGQSPSGPFSSPTVTGAGGTIALEQETLLASAATLQVVTPGFLVRETLLRSASETTFTLWPSQSPTGLDEAHTSALVYSPSSCPAVSTGTDVLRRLRASATRVAIVFGSGLQDAAAASAHQTAAARLTAAIGGAVNFGVSPIPDAPVVFTAIVDPTAATCASGSEQLRAATSLTLTDGEITGGTLTYCTVQAARNVTLVLHELGHTLGLRHSPSQSDVMYCTSGRPDGFSSRERLVMTLMRQRRSGNRFPDDDRDTSLPSASDVREVMFSCGH